MSREFIQELRGDVRKEAIDIYDHIDKKELRESYLAHISQLGIKGTRPYREKCLLVSPAPLDRGFWEKSAKNWIAPQCPPDKQPTLSFWKMPRDNLAALLFSLGIILPEAKDIALCVHA
jgi:hypothetical protein